jgi:hypothetical protein
MSEDLGIWVAQRFQRCYRSLKNEVLASEVPQGLKPPPYIQDSPQALKACATQKLRNPKLSTQKSLCSQIAIGDQLNAFLREQFAGGRQSENTEFSLPRRSQTGLGGT